MENPDEIQRLLEEHFNYDEISDSENAEDDQTVEEEKDYKKTITITLLLTQKNYHRVLY